MKSDNIKLRLSADCNRAGPIVMGLIAQILKQHGAEVIFNWGIEDVLNTEKVSLAGLEVYLDKVTWVRQEEAERW